MNKNVLLLIGILILIVLGAGAFILFKNSSKAPVSAVTQPAKTTVSSNQPVSSKTLKDLITSGQAQKCTFKSKDTSQAAVEGISYIANGKMRGDFSTTVGGKTMATHMIISDKKDYTWIEGQTTGFVIAFDPTQAAPTGTSNSQSVDLNKVVDYSCSGWSVDNSMLIPPANIKFTQMGSAMMPTGSAGATTAPQNQCAACNYLSGAAKTQCLTALKCN